MRARTRRLRSFWRGIVVVSFGCTTGHSPAARHGERKGPTIRIRECAPLCLVLDSCWGGVSRGWARTGAKPTMARAGPGVKTGAMRSLHVPQVAAAGPLGGGPNGTLVRLGSRVLAARPGDELPRAAVLHQHVGPSTVRGLALL